MPIEGGASGGTGSGGSDIRAGGAFYELQARDNVSQTLTRIESKLNTFKAKLKSVGGAAFFGGAIGGGLSGALTNIGEKAGTAFADMITGAGELADKLSSTERLMSRITEHMARASKIAAEWRGAETDPSKRAAMTRARFEELDELGKGLGADWESANREFKALSRKTLGGFARFVAGGGEDKAAMLAGKRVDDIGRQLRAVASEMEGLKEEYKRLMDPNKDPGVIGRFNRALEEAKDTIATMGMSPAEKLVHGFEKLGLATDKMRELKGVLDLVDLAEHQEKWRGRKSDTPWLNTALSAIPVVMEATKRLTDAFETTRGGLGASSAPQRFGYGDMAVKEQITHLKKIAENTDPGRQMQLLVEVMEMR